MHYRDFVGTGKKLIVYHHWWSVYRLTFSKAA